MKQYLNKADLTSFIQCPTSAFYGWQGHASKHTDDPFLNFLSEEGKSVGRAAYRLSAEATPFNESNVKRAATQSGCFWIHKL